MSPDSPSLPVIDPSALDDGAGDDPVAGVLLAAGTGSRFAGGNKLLADLDGEPVVRHAARTLTAVDLDPLVAVVGHEADRVRTALSGLGFRIVSNPDYEQGQATSVRTGVEALENAGVEGAVFALGDMPRVAPASIRRLRAAYRAGEAAALAAACEGQRGNPVLFDRRYFPALSDVSGDVGGRAILLDGENSALVETDDPGVTRDVDTREDLEQLRRSRD